YDAHSRSSQKINRGYRIQFQMPGDKKFYDYKYGITSSKTAKGGPNAGLTKRAIRQVAALKTKFGGYWKAKTVKTFKGRSPALDWEEKRIRDGRRTSAPHPTRGFPGAPPGTRLPGNRLPRVR